MTVCSVVLSALHVQMEWAEAMDASYCRGGPCLSGSSEAKLCFWKWPAWAGRVQKAEAL